MQLSHRDIRETLTISLKLLVKSVNDLVPTLANKNVWLSSEEMSLLCGESNLNHVLSSCTVTLS